MPCKHKWETTFTAAMPQTLRAASRGIVPRPIPQGRKCTLCGTRQIRSITYVAEEDRYASKWVCSDPKPKLHAGPSYRVRTWDQNAGHFGQFTVQKGLSVPSDGMTLRQLRVALRELRNMGYTCERVRSQDGSYSSDPSVLVEREP